MQPRGIPIGLSSVDWKNFSHICKETLGISPIKVVDERGLKTDEPLSFSYSIEGFTGDLEESFKHTSITFLFQMDAEDALYLAKNDFTITVLMNTKFVTLLVSGRLSEFYDLIRRSTDLVNPDDVILSINTIIYKGLCQLGFQKIFKKFNRQIDSRGNILLS